MSNKSADMFSVFKIQPEKCSSKRSELAKDGFGGLLGRCAENTCNNERFTNPHRMIILSSRSRLVM